MYASGEDHHVPDRVRCSYPSTHLYVACSYFIQIATGNDELTTSNASPTVCFEVLFLLGGQKGFV